MPEYRYSSAADMANDLNAILNSKILKTAPPTAPMGVPTARMGNHARPSMAQQRPAPQRVSQRAASSQTNEGPSTAASIVKFLVTVGFIIFGYFEYQKNSKPHIVVINEPAIGNSAQSQTTVPSDPLPPPPEISIPSTPTPAAPTAPNAMRELLPAEPIASVPPPPTVQPTLSSQTKAELDAFYQRARKIMKDKAAPAVAEHNRKNVSLLDDYQREVKALIRKLDSNQPREILTDTLQVYITQCKTNDNTLTKNPNPEIAAKVNVVLYHMQALEKQKSINDTFTDSISQMSATYILGLEKQIDRYKAANENAAIELIKEEIDTTRASNTYFTNLIIK